MPAQTGLVEPLQLYFLFTPTCVGIRSRVKFHNWRPDLPGSIQLLRVRVDEK